MIVRPRRMPPPVINLAINGRFLCQPTTGVQRVARELTREFDRLVEEGEDRFRIRLLCPPGADLSDPKAALEASLVQARIGAGGGPDVVVFNAGVTNSQFRRSPEGM